MEFKELLAELKKAGLNIGEDAVKDVIKAVFVASEAYVKKTKTPYDDFLIPFFGVAQQRVLEAADKIDGEVDAEKG